MFYISPLGCTGGARAQLWVSGSVAIGERTPAPNFWGPVRSFLRVWGPSTNIFVSGVVHCGVLLDPNGDA